MRTCTSTALFSACVATLLALSPATSALAQGGRSGPAARPAMRTHPDLVDAYGNQAVVPVQYVESCNGGSAYGYAGDCYGGGYGGSGAPCAGFGGACYQPDQCGPHFFDVSVEYVTYIRDNSFGQDIDFTSNGFVMAGTPLDIVLSSSDISDDFEPGFRVTGRYDVGPLSVLEASYSGFFNMGSSATATDPDNRLFSLFTGFGANPAGGFDNSDAQLFEETDRASEHSIEFGADLQNTELSLRRYWVGYSPRITGTLLAGFRYSKLKEFFAFRTVGNDFANSGDDASVLPGVVGIADYRVVSDNNLAGAQIGGDMWVCLRQGLRMGFESKVGLYNNDYELYSTFTTTDGDPSISEVYKDNHAAFIGELRWQLVADILPSLSVKGGYELLFMDQLALAGDNFNSGSPYTGTGIADRVPFVNDSGDALFHGINCGIEYIW